MNIGFPVVQTDGWAAGGVRSRDYQIFWDEWIYLAIGRTWSSAMKYFIAELHVREARVHRAL